MDRASNMFKKAGVHFLAKPIDQERLLFAVKKAVSEGKAKETVKT